MERYKVLAERLRPMVIESVSFLHAQMKLDKHVLVEGANAAMLDIDFGKSFFHNRAKGLLKLHFYFCYFCCGISPKLARLFGQKSTYSEKIIVLYE